MAWTEICTHGILPEEDNFCTVVKRTLRFFSHRWNIFTNTLLWGEKHDLFSGPIRCFVKFWRAARLVVGASLHEVQIACLEFLAMGGVHSVTWENSSLSLRPAHDHAWLGTVPARHGHLPRAEPDLGGALHDGDLRQSPDRAPHVPHDLGRRGLHWRISRPQAPDASRVSVTVGRRGGVGGMSRLSAQFRTRNGWVKD